MKLMFRLSPIIWVAMFLTVMGCGHEEAPSVLFDTSFATDDHRALSARVPGILTMAVDSSCPCDSGTSCECFTFTVSNCGLSDHPHPNLNTGVVRVSVRSGSVSATKIATLFSHKGGVGTSFWDGDLHNALLDAGYRIAQIRWNSSPNDPQSGWQHTDHPDGTVAAACRPATVLDQFYEEATRLGKSYPNGRINADMCTMSMSGGSAAMAYALVHYGLKSKMDYMWYASGPPMAEMSIGCDPQGYANTGAWAAYGNVEPTFGGRPGAGGPKWAAVRLTGQVDRWMHQTSPPTCAGGSYAVDGPALRNMSILNGAEDLQVGIRVDGTWCTRNPNATFIGGFLFQDALARAGQNVHSHFYDNGTNYGNESSSCRGEKVTDDPSIVSDIVALYDAHCGSN